MIAESNFYELIAASYSSAEAKAVKNYRFTDAARSALGEAGLAVLTEFLPVPGACALMSALYAQAIRSRVDDPVHVFAGTLDADGVRVFGQTRLAQGPTPCLRGDLDWDGHMWVMVGNQVADISLLRTAKSSGGHPRSNNWWLANFGPVPALRFGQSRTH